MRPRRNVITFADILILRCIMEHEKSAASSLPIRRIQACYNTFLDEHAVPARSSLPLTSIDKIQRSIARWKLLGILKPGVPPRYFASTPAAEQFWRDLKRYRRSEDWTKWPLEVPIYFEDRGPVLDWGNAI